MCNIKIEDDSKILI